MGTMQTDSVSLRGHHAVAYRRVDGKPSTLRITHPG
jgi:hypothetical protein